MTGREKLELQLIHRELHRLLERARVIGDHHDLVGRGARIDEMLENLRNGPAPRNARYIPPDERLRIATQQRQDSLDREAQHKRAQYARRREREEEERNHAS